MRVNQVSFVMKRGRLLHVIGFHIDRDDMLADYLAAQTPLCKYIEVQHNVEMRAPFYQKYSVKVKANGKFAIDVQPFA